MNKDKYSLSANEINKFTYCPYQWYYEKKYGMAALRKLARERNENLGLEDATLSQYRKGLRFHQKYHSKFRLKRILLEVFLLAILVMICFLLLAGGTP